MKIGDHEIEELLKEVFPPIDRELPRDLWPAMLRRLQTPRTALSWFDRTLIVALCSWAFFYPPGILQLLYHL